MQQFSNTQQGKRPSRQYFLKDKKAQVYAMETIVSQKDGHETNRYVSISKTPLWCYTRQLSQDQILIAALARTTEEIRYFVFNYRDDIHPYDRILYKGTIYEVTRVDYTDDYKGETFVYVKYLTLSKQGTGDHGLRPYGWKPEDENFTAWERKNVSNSDTFQRTSYKGWNPWK